VHAACAKKPKPDELFLIAEDDAGAPVGFAYAVTGSDFFTGEPYLHVSEIATVRRGGGVGAVLMDAVEARARERGYRFVTLNVVDENAAGRRFYERHGLRDRPPSLREALLTRAPRLT
jgi:diamine N-acetyltransferase